MSDAVGQLVVLVGHPKPGSRTHQVAVRAGTALCQALGAAGVPFAEPDVVDLAELAPQLLDRYGPNPSLASAIQQVRRSTLLVAASPTFRGAYSGLLKFFLDVLPRDGLAATVALPLMTAGLVAHRSAVDATLRPVLLELRARVPAAGISVLESELTAFDAVFEVWWARHGLVLSGALRDRVEARAEVRS
jgi:FMN reductase